jgi:hypothetical protein
MKIGRKIPWPFESYTPLEPHDLDEAPPSPEQRNRVAAALRDIRQIRNFLESSWAAKFRYDAEDSAVRFEQTRRAYSS